MRKLIAIVGLSLLYQIGFAQNETDVLRYSTTDVFGSARFEAMAGSFGGLGADFSAIQINPASMGRFSSSAVSLSMNTSMLTNSAMYNDVSTDSKHSKFTIGSLGVVITNDISARNVGRRYNQISLGYTRLKNFANTRKYEGQNFYSLLDVLAADGNGVPLEFIYEDRPFTTGLAYDVYAVDYDGIDDVYYSRLTMGDMYHDREIGTNGGIGEFHIGYSENYMNRWYYGASLGIRRTKYTESFNHYERLLDTLGTSLRSFNYMYEQESAGFGVNLKLGVLFLPVEEFRIGLAFETPTITSMKEEWTNNMTALHDFGMESVHPDHIPRGKFEYRVKTPMKLRGSVAYVFGMRGAINVDLEMSRLPGGRLKPSNSLMSQGGGYDFAFENEEVKYQFRTVLNTRIGIEYMLFQDFFVRGGLALLPQPYKKEIGNDYKMSMTYSAGIGWENRFFQVDLAYRLLTLNEDYYAFDPSQIENRTQFKTNIHNIVITAGFKF